LVEKNGSMNGQCDDQFGGVAVEFERNFSVRGDVGAAVCVIVDGQVVVDLWGGVADPVSGRAWEPDTVTTVFSASKGPLALCAHLLVARGELAFDDPVARYWPEFAAAGKQDITVSMALSHQAGLPGFRETLPDGGLLDWERCTGLLAAQEPLWEPGTRHGYHAFTWGFIIGELLRRITGVRGGKLFRDLVGDPVDLDVWLGLPEDQLARVAATLPASRAPEQMPRAIRAAMADPECIPGRVFTNTGDWSFERLNTPEAYTGEVLGVNGIANARGLATFYSPLANAETSPVALEPLMAVCSASSRDATFGIGTRFSLGFQKGCDNRWDTPGNRGSILIPDTAFGHPGRGGAIGFADPAAGLAFAYVMSQCGTTSLLDERGEALIAATYAALGQLGATA
jgi:CubicO group peptidase (beta-lactamase class C family)